MWMAALFGTVLDIAISVAIAQYLDGNAVITFFVLQAVLLAAWVRRSVGAWLWWFVTGKSAFVQQATHFLRTNSFPMPDTYYQSANDYFLQIASDEKLPMMVRLVAAKEVGAIGALSSSGQMQLALRVAMALEEAIREYGKEAPARTT